MNFIKLAINGFISQAKRLTQMLGWFNSSRPNIVAPQIEINAQYQAFIARLTTAKQRTGAGLSNRNLTFRVTASDLQAIIDYCLLPRIQQIIQGLKPNDSYRFEKNTGLPRTTTIIRDEIGYQCIVNTGSKMSFYNDKGVSVKSAMVRAEGHSKHGKAGAWRIDSPVEQPLWKATAILSKHAPENRNMVIERLQKEEHIPKILNSKFFQPTVLGPAYYRKHLLKINLYSGHCPTDLFDHTTKTYTTTNQKNLYIADMLHAVKALHDQGYAHQDIKLENFLVKPDGSLALTDLETVEKISHQTANLGTPTYYPFDIVYYSLTEKLATEKTFEHNLAYQLACSKPALFQDYISSTHTRLAHDIWTLGISIYILKYQLFPCAQNFWQEIKQDPLLEGLLRLDPDQRFTIDQAIAVFNRNLQTTAPAPILLRKGSDKAMQQKNVQTLVPPTPRLNLKCL